MNIMPAKIVEAGASTVISLKDGSRVSVPLSVDAAENGKSASFGVRPEDLSIATGDDFLFEGTVEIVEALGEVTLLYVAGPVEEEPVVVKLPGIVDVKKGEKLRFAADRTKLHLFDAAGKSYYKK